jgi:hypothetical protein
MLTGMYHKVEFNCKIVFMGENLKKLIKERINYETVPGDISGIGLIMGCFIRRSSGLESDTWHTI